MSRVKNTGSGIRYVINCPIKGQIYTGWAIALADEEYQPIDYLEIDGSQVLPPSKLETSKGES